MMKNKGKVYMTLLLLAVILCFGGIVAKAYAVPAAARTSTVKASGKDDRQAIQKALDKAKGKSGYTKVILQGNFKLSGGSLQIYSNTIVDATAAAITKSGSNTCIMRNDTRNTVGGYELSKNIWLVGGTWDGGDLLKATDGSNNFSFVHCTNVNIVGAVIRNNFGAHLLEICASKDVLVQDCRFYGFRHNAQNASNAEHSLALQLDMAVEPHMPLGYKADNTACANVSLIHNIFNETTSCEHFCSCLGCNTADYPQKGLYHKNIVIANNILYNAGLADAGSGVYVCGVNGFSVTGNRIYSPKKRGIYLRYAQNGSVNYNTVQNSGDNSILVEGPAQVAEINGNQITGSQANGIKVHGENCRAEAVRGNEITGCALYGVYASAPVGEVSQNRMSGNQKADLGGPTNISSKSNNGPQAVVYAGADYASSTPPVPVTAKQVEVTGVKVSLSKATIGVGESLQLSAYVKPANATDQRLTYQSSKSKVAAVSDSGMVTGKKTGSTTITVKAANGKSKKVAITVKKKPSKISFSKKKVTIKKKKSYQLKVRLSAKSASYHLTYTSSNPRVATVSAKGKVKALQKGTTTITVRTYNGKKAKVKVKVK